MRSSLGAPAITQDPIVNVDLIKLTDDILQQLITLDAYINEYKAYRSVLGYFSEDAKKTKYCQNVQDRISAMVKSHQISFDDLNAIFKLSVTQLEEPEQGLGLTSVVKKMVPSLTKLVGQFTGTNISPVSEIEKLAHAVRVNMVVLMKKLFPRAYQDTIDSLLDQKQKEEERIASDHERNLNIEQQKKAKDALDIQLLNLHANEIINFHVENGFNTQTPTFDTKKLPAGVNVNPNIPLVYQNFHELYLELVINPVNTRRAAFQQAVTSSANAFKPSEKRSPMTVQQMTLISSSQSSNKDGEKEKDDLNSSAKMQKTFADSPPPSRKNEENDIGSPQIISSPISFPEYSDEDEKKDKNKIEPEAEPIPFDAAAVIPKPVEEPKPSSNEESKPLSNREKKAKAKAAAAALARDEPQKFGMKK